MSDREVIVRSLIRFGHSGAKAFEIAIDCERGDAHAAEWVNRALKHDCDTMTDRAVAAR